MARAPGNYDALRDAQRRALESQTASPGQNQASPDQSTPQIDSGARAEARPHEAQSRPPGYYQSLRDDQQAAQSPSASEQMTPPDRSDQVKSQGPIAGGWPPESQSRGDQEAWAAQRHKELNQPLQQKFREEISAQNNLVDASNMEQKEQSASQSKQGDVEKAAATQRALEKANAIFARQSEQSQDRDAERSTQSQER